MGMARADQGGGRDEGTNRRTAKGKSRMEGIVEGKTGWKAWRMAWNGISKQVRAEKGNTGQGEAWYGTGAWADSA